MILMQIIVLHLSRLQTQETYNIPKEFQSKNTQYYAVMIHHMSLDDLRDHNKIEWNQTSWIAEFNFKAEKNNVWKYIVGHTNMVLFIDVLVDHNKIEWNQAFWIIEFCFKA